MKKRILVATTLLLLLSTYVSNRNFNFRFNFKINEIIIENNKVLSKDEVKNELSFLYKDNISLIKHEKFKKKLDENSFLSGFEIKKIYPNKLKVKVFEKNPIFILQNKKKKFYYTEKNQLITFSKIDRFKNLPTIFGDKDNFEKFYTNLKKMNFPIDTIKTFYLFESKRWDLLTNDNKTIKLPIKNYDQSLMNYTNIIGKKNFQKYKIFDYRINNQLILK